MAKCCNDNLSKIFCNAYNKYYNTLYTNGEISKKETENLLVISYIRKLFINPRYINYRPILIKALRCIADRSCLLDSSELYGRLDIKTVGDKFVTVLMRDIYSVKIKETDPTVPLYVKDIKQSDITNWNSKLSLETDPIFSASPAATITEEDIDNWNNSGGTDVFKINCVYDGESIVSCDKTFAQILEAYNEDKILAVNINDSLAIGNLNLFLTDAVTFNVIDTIDVAVRSYELTIFSNNTYTILVTEIPKLISGTNIKTINNSSILGNGNIDLVPTETFNNFCPIIEDTRSSSVATITGVAPFGTNGTIPAGQRIIIHFKYNTANGSTLTLTLSDETTTSAIPLKASYHNSGNYNVDSDLKCNAGSYMPFIYNATDSVWHSLGDIDYFKVPPSMSAAFIQEGTSTIGFIISPKLFHDNAYIVELSYSSGSLKANKMYDFGTVSSALTIPSLDATNDLVSNALNFYALRFIAGADNLSITFPTGVIVDDEPTINTGDYVEIMINKYGNNFYASIKVWQAQ